MGRVWEGAVWMEEGIKLVGDGGDKFWNLNTCPS